MCRSCFGRRARGDKSRARKMQEGHILLDRKRQYRIVHILQLISVLLHPSSKTFGILTRATRLVFWALLAGTAGWGVLVCPCRGGTQRRQKQRRNQAHHGGQRGVYVIYIYIYRVKTVRGSRPQMNETRGEDLSPKNRGLKRGCSRNAAKDATQANIPCCCTVSSDLEVSQFVRLSVR